MLNFCAPYDFNAAQSPRVLFLRAAIALAKSIGLHLPSSTYEYHQQQKERRRTWWCCFVQDRNTSLTTNEPPFITSTDTPKAGHTDFEFRCITSTAYGSDAALSRDTLAQMCVAYLFKLKVYLCCSLSTITGLDAVLWEQTERQMDAWYTSLLDLVRAESLDPGVHACLFTQWSSLVLLYRTISLREGRRRVLDVVGRAQQLSDTHVLYVEIKRSWSIMVKIVKELQRSGQLRYVGDAGLWALLPSIAAVRESLFTWPH